MSGEQVVTLVGYLVAGGAVYFAGWQRGNNARVEELEPRIEALERVMLGHLIEDRHDKQDEDTKWWRAR